MMPALVKRLAWACAGLMLAGLAQAQSVSLQGVMGGKALLMVDGGAPSMVAPGQSHQGVKLLSVSGDEAVVLVDGERLTLRVGAVPVSVAGQPVTGGTQVSLTADSRGHFITQGSINGRPVQFMVDTGATVVAISQAEADRLGLNYRNGKRVVMNTANGMTPGWVLKLSQVRVGDVLVYDVDAVVTASSMPMTLLGNSFLARFNMRREGSLMTLVKR